MKAVVLKKWAGHGSSLASSGAGNSGRPFGLLRNLAKGVK